MEAPSIACRVCRSLRHQRVLITKDFNQEKSDGTFEYYQCRNCASIWLHPVPENIGFYYNQDYPAYSTGSSPNTERRLQFLDQSKLSILKEHIQSGKLVEIGPASGRFLKLANQAGFDVFGIEQDAGCVKHIGETLKLNAICSAHPAVELAKLSNSCDAIVAWHVVEHLEGLIEFVNAASNALRKPHGVLVVSAPNPESWSFRLFGRFWVHLDAPRHLSLIPLQALDELMSKHGLKRVAVTFSDPVGIQLNKMAWQCSLMNLSSNRRIKRPWLAILGRLLSLPMALLDRLPEKGAAYTVVYRHDDRGTNHVEVMPSRNQT